MSQQALPKQELNKVRLSNDELRALTPQNIVGFFADRGQPLTDLTGILGNGFHVLETSEKRGLNGVEFIIVEWHFTNGAQGEFVSLTVVTSKGDKYIVNDGSSGIRDQIHTLEERGIDAPVLVSKGLRSSVYYFAEGDPTTKYKSEAHALAEDVAPSDIRKAETFYLAV